MIQGVESQTESENEAVEHAFVKGRYAYSYYVNDYKDFVGEIKFKFEYIIINGQINYRFYDFEHDKLNSTFKSIGLLPKQWNENVKVSFTKKEYVDIVKDLKSNAANAIRIITKYCLK